MNENHTISCPYCGEPNELVVDHADAGQSYTEDCAVCCQPMGIRIHADQNGEVESIEATRENS